MTAIHLIIVINDRVDQAIDIVSYFDSFIRHSPFFLILSSLPRCQLIS